MRIVFITSVFEFGLESLKSLLAQGETIISVIMPPLDSEDRRGLAVKQIATDHDIQVYEWKSVNSSERVDHIRTWNADLAVSAGNMHFIFKKPFLDSFTHGAINYHCSLLPENGGMYPIHWQIYKGLDYIGITIHQCDQEIDTGDLLIQRTVPINPDEGFKAIYFGKVLQASVDLLSEAVRQIREGQSNPKPQDHSLSTYNPPFGPEHWTINWSDSAKHIYNVIRACDAWPGAKTTFRGQDLKIWQAKLLGDIVSKDKPGTIQKVTDAYFDVAVRDGTIRVERVQWGSDQKLMVSDFIKTCDLSPGEFLGS